MGWLLGVNCTGDAAELLVAKDRSKLSRAVSPPESQPEPTPRHLNSGSPRSRAPWSGVR